MKRIVMPDNRGPGLYIPDHSLDRFEIDRFSMGWAGHVRAILRDANTGGIVREWGFRNLITNAGLDLFGTNANTGLLSNPSVGAFPSLPYLAAGTDNTAPANTDTTLGAEIAGGRSVTEGSPLGTDGWNGAVSPDYAYSRVSRRLATTQGNGSIRELGIFSTAAAGVMIARALPKDSLGAPTTIVKTSAQVLDVIWEFRLYPLQADATENVVVNGITYAMTYRPGRLNASWNILARYGGAWWAGAVSGSAKRFAALYDPRAGVNPTGPTSLTPVIGAYSTGNYYRDWQITPGATTACLGISGMPPTSADSFQIRGVPDLPNVALTVRQSWGRYP